MQKTTLKTEIIAGLTSFVTMAYIVFINPAILKETGMDQGSIFVATCLVAAFGSLCAGFFAKSPIGIAPGMALNIYFCYSVVIKLGLPWQEALGIIFISGILFLIVSILGFAKIFVRAVPHNLQVSILIGISLFISLIALHTNHIIEIDDKQLLHLGNIKSIETLLFFLGFIIILYLDYYKFSAAIMFGIIIITIISLLLGLTPWEGILHTPPSIKPTFMQLRLEHVLDGKYISIVFAFFLITIFDATGTLVGLLNPTIFHNKVEHERLIKNSLIANAASSTFASLVGCSSTTPFIETASGIQAGGRRGVTAITIGFGFLFLLFCFPLAKMIPNYALGPALLYVSCCMIRQVGALDLADITQAAPSMLTIILIPYTSSIADGIGVGVILYTFLHFITKKSVDKLMFIFSLLFLLFFICN